MPNIITKKLFQGDSRTIKAKKNILGSLGLKGISILISLQVVPMTIHYINPIKYGIWLTLSSIITWISYFDLGFAHGFRNRFAEAQASNNITLAKKYVSTTYAILFLLFTSIFIIAAIISHFVSWSKILNVDASLDQELHTVFLILLFFFCTNIVASIFTTLLTADQKPALASVIQTGGQFLAFIIIFILTRTTDGNLVYLAFSYTGIPCILLVITSIIYLYFGKYKQYKPEIKDVDLNLVKDILNLGGQFFIIMISMLLIFQLINIIISRVEGPEVVTQYNIAYKYFNVLSMLATIVLTPFWSAFTEAYTVKDFTWMKKTQQKLERLWLICIPTSVIMVLCAPYIYQWWIGNIYVPNDISIIVCLYFLFQILGNIYMYLINGIGKVRIQLMIYVLFAIISIPVLNWSCKEWGVIGLLVTPTIVFLVQAIFCKIQLKKIISQRATGIWNK